MSESSPQDAKPEWVEDIVRILSYVSNGPVLRRRAEDFLSPRPANIASETQQVRALQKRVDRLVVGAGGAPRDRSSGLGRRHDTYVNAVVTEALNSLYRARRAVIDAHLLYVGASALRQHPDWLLGSPVTPGSALSKAIDDDLWESLEIAYIRLASYWDRVGQLLDFFHFGIRHFERDGFSAVFDRIALNIAAVDENLASNPAFERLKQFHASEKPTGYKWLARRRNLVVHSLHLRPGFDDASKQLVDELYNHLSVRLRAKLKPGTVTEEVERLHGQLDGVCALFPDVLALCEERQKLVRASNARRYSPKRDNAKR